MKPILFNTDMVRAILAGRKTVTRRVIKPGSLRVLDSQYHKEHPEIPDKQLIEKLCAPPYNPNDVLYVREKFAHDGFDGHEDIYVYWADVDECGRVVWGDQEDEWAPCSDYNWRPSIHMPKEAARIFLRVTAVRVERLWGSFPNQGAVALAFEEEGIQLPEECEDCVDRYGCPCGNDLDESLPYDEQTGEDSEGGSECGTLDEVRLVFSELWDSTIEKPKREIYGSDANPWVWVIEFERCERPKEV